MAESTGINWAHSTLNYWIGCTRVSPACGDDTGGGCYAEREWADRRHRVVWGPKGDRSPTKTWAAPYKWQRDAEAFFARYGERRRVFVNSLSDWGDNHRSIRQEWRGQGHRAWRECPDLDFLILTKRPQNYLKHGFLPADWSAERYPNVWLGTTVEDQVEADRRIPHLLATPAAKHWLSCEPLLGPLDLKLPDADECYCDHEARAFFGARPAGDLAASHTGVCPHSRRVDWIIAGGESGKNARPSHPDWFRSLRDQCGRAGVAFYFKQWGEFRPYRSETDDFTKNDPTGEYGNNGARHILNEGERPGAENIVIRVGKKAAGRLLDGVEHRAVPA